MKREYHAGTEAAAIVEKMMKHLFRAPKTIANPATKPTLGATSSSV
jgi:hypothetical protein